MLRQVPCGNRPTTRSTVCPTTKKKKPTTQPTKQVSALPLASLLASAPSASSSMTITKQDSAANTPSMGMKLETKIEPMMPRIIYEVEKEEDMAANLRASFKERQHKRLSESITVAPPSAKKSCTEVPRSEPILNIQQMLKPQADATRTNRVLAARPPIGKNVSSKQGMASIGPAPLK